MSFLSHQTVVEIAYYPYQVAFANYHIISGMNLVYFAIQDFGFQRD